MWQFDSKSATWTDSDRGLSIVSDTRSVAEVERSARRIERQAMAVAFDSAKQCGLLTGWGKWKRAVLFKLPNGNIQSLQVLLYCCPTPYMQFRPLIMRIHLNHYPVKVSRDTASALNIHYGMYGEFVGGPHRMELSCLPEETDALAEWMCRWLVDISDPCPFETEEELVWQRNERNEYVWTRASKKKINTFQTWQSDRSGK